MKKIPTRTCIGCGEQKPKNELIRIVKNQTGEIDPWLEFFINPYGEEK